MSNFKTGKVVQTINDKTITVLVVSYKNHPLYRKRYIVSKKYLVHDPENQAQLKDTVKIKQSRPISKHKSWILDQIISQAQQNSATKPNQPTKTKQDKLKMLTKPTASKKSDSKPQPKKTKLPEAKPKSQKPKPASKKLTTKGTKT